MQAVGSHVLGREKLEVSVRVLARVLHAIIQGERQACSQEPSVKMVEVAVRVLLRLAARTAKVALKVGKLRGLGAEEHGGIVWVSGRIRGEKLAELLGTSALPVLLPEEPLAKSLMWKAHREDHRQRTKRRSGQVTQGRLDRQGNEACQVSHRQVLPLQIPGQEASGTAHGTTPR